MELTKYILTYVAAINVVTFVVYGIDKLKAKKHWWRVPESVLLWMAALGGAVGAWCGMKVWHHKTLHKKFKYGVPAIFMTQVTLIVFAICHLRKTPLWAVCLAMTLLATSCSDDIISQDEELYSLSRASLLRMDTGERIAVIGHKSQDPDAVCASISMATLMQTLGMDAVPYMQEKPIQGVKYILDTFGLRYPDIMTGIEPGMPLVLMDHNDPLQSVDGMLAANVVGIVDHHPVSQTFSSKLPIYYNCMNVGSSCSIVYGIYRECGIVPSQQMARIMAAGIIADTESLTKATCTKTDSMALNSLAKLAGISDMAALMQGISMAQDSFDGLTDKEIFMSDIKSYEIGGVTLAITSLDANEKMHIDELCQRMHSVMQDVANQLGVQMVFAKMEESLKDANGEYILDSEGNKQYVTHFAYYGDGAKEVAEAAYGKSSADHRDCIVLSRKLSRKTDIVPDLTNILEHYTKR